MVTYVDFATIKQPWDPLAAWPQGWGRERRAAAHAALGAVGTEVHPDCSVTPVTFHSRSGQPRGLHRGSAAHSLPVPETPTEGLPPRKAVSAPDKAGRATPPWAAGHQRSSAFLAGAGRGRCGRSGHSTGPGRPGPTRRRRDGDAPCSQGRGLAEAREGSMGAGRGLGRVLLAKPS